MMDMEPHLERENVKNTIRKGISKGNLTLNIRNLERKGGADGRGADYSHVKGLDEQAEYLANNYPHLVEDDNPEQTVFNMLKEGVKRPPGKTSPEFMDKFEEALQNGYSLTPEPVATPTKEPETEEEKRIAAEPLPFAKVRTGNLLRY